MIGLIGQKDIDDIYIYIYMYMYIYMNICGLINVYTYLYIEMSLYMYKYICIYIQLKRGGTYMIGLIGQKDINDYEITVHTSNPQPVHTVTLGGMYVCVYICIYIYVYMICM
jgi:hypothetical protein